MSISQKSSFNPSPQVPNFDHLAPLFITLHVAGGQVGLPIIIATFLFSKNVHRHPTLINFCATWFIYSVSHSMLLYSGKMHDPEGSLCFAQSAMIHGAPPMCAVATLAVVFQVWRTFHEPLLNLRSNRWTHTAQLTLTLMLPYIAFLTFTIVSTTLQYKNPGLLVTNGLYCSYNGYPFRRWGSPIFCTIMLILIIIFEVIIAVRYFRAWRQITAVFPLADRRTSPALVLRILTFSVYSIITLSSCIFFLMNDSHRAYPWPYFVQAALPLTAFVVFGTQKDLLLTWFFCLGKRTPTVHTAGSSESSIPTFQHPNSSSTGERSCSPTNTIPLRMIEL